MIRIRECVSCLLTYIFLGCASLWGADAQVEGGPAYISPPVRPLSVQVPPAPPDAATPALQTPVTVPEGEPLPTDPPPPRQPIRDPVFQPESAEDVSAAEAIGLISRPVVNVRGIGTAANPPDTVADVGRKHVVEMVNATFFQIFDKEGRALTGPISFGSLWPAGAICRANAGDPIVVYDHLANRWLLSQFARPNHMCVAISQTPDPTSGRWFLYTFDTRSPGLPDYPKFGVWPNGYYMSSYEFPNLGVYVFDRTNMLLGFAAGFFKSVIPSLGAPGVRDTRILPADLDGQTPPSSPSNFFVRTVDDQQDPANPVDRIEVYEALPDWTNLTFSFTLVDTLTPAPFQTMLCNRDGAGVRDCVPQPDEVDNLDALSNRPMMQLKYRNFGLLQALVFNQTIDVSGSIRFVLGFTPADEVAGVRWYELRNFGFGPWFIHQQGTWAPQPRDATAEEQLLHRWMGSAAIDRFGNIALGYSITNSSDDHPVFSGIRYTGRHFDDPLDLLSQGERVIRNGDTAEGNGDEVVEAQRWGDYSALSVDPVDDCTFWYTTHLAAVGSSHPTRLASFRIDPCGKAAH